MCVSVCVCPRYRYAEQLADALKKNATRVLDLFRSWDADGDGEVTRAEFHKAMPALGLDVPKAEIDKLFDSWDREYPQRGSNSGRVGRC